MSNFQFLISHGMQIRGSNYLIPIDMAPTSESGVASRAFSAFFEVRALTG